MKPLRLSLQAFGSYAGELTVDFARLSRHGIFAISGPTGAGKSTIFDALVYALYDDLPGFRVDGNVRSQYAAEEVETRVRLEFEVRGERWAVERTPTQLVRRRRGQGAPIERKSTVVLERVGEDGMPVAGSGLSRKSAVADRIDALVGLSKEQFEQVVLIPQGRFEEVLKADTRARAVLLRRLFPVDVYGRVTAALKAMADERQHAYSEATRAFDDLLGRLGSSLVAALQAAGEAIDLDLSEAGALDVDHLSAHLAALSSARLSLERRVGTAASEHDQMVRALEDARRTTASWDRWRADVAQAATFAADEASDAREATALARARRVADLDAALRAWEQATAELAVAEPACAALRDRVRTACAGVGAVVDEALADVGEAVRLAERLRRDAETLHAEIAVFEALVESDRSLASRRRDLADRRRAVDRRSVQRESERGAVEELAAELDELARVALDLAVVRAGVETLDAERGVSLRRRAADDELAAAALAREEAARGAAAAQGRLEDVRTAWRNGLAGRLAQLLVDGAPCPTCGATDHPSPAPMPHDAPDDDALAAADSACEEAHLALRRAEARHATAVGVVRALGDARPFEVVDAELAARRAELARCQDAVTRLADLRDDLAKRRAALDAQALALDAETRQLDGLEAGLLAEEAAHQHARAQYERRHGGLVSPADRAGALAGLAQEIDRLAELLAVLERAGASEHQCRSVLGSLLDELGLDSPSALAAWRCGPEEIAERAAALHARAEARADVRRRIAEYETSGGPSVRPDLSSMEAAAESARTRHFELVRRQAVMEENAGFFVAGPSMIETAVKEVESARRALEQARTMADRCAGAGGGASPTRLSLENWVLADYLRQVLRQANERLATMTGGRFALQLSEGITDGRKAWGLELSAFDAYTGQVRPATTLSGGETFMAALALALGLADVVSGGSNREMGALFVDEGFGSLDPQSLESVVDVLRSLEDGGRLVGVVSHVEAVQHALPCGISVRTTPCGSVAEVHYPDP